MAGLESEIRAALERALQPTRLLVENESALHAGHAGDDGSGESHFAVEIESRAFAGQSRVARQRAVFDALGPLMDRIHALRMKTEAP